MRYRPNRTKTQSPTQDRTQPEITHTSHGRRRLVLQHVQPTRSHARRAYVRAHALSRSRALARTMPAFISLTVNR